MYDYQEMQETKGCLQMSKPIEHCYWVVPGRLLAGEYPGNIQHQAAKERIEAFQRCGISAFINLTQPHELTPYEELLTEATHHRFGIRDVSVPYSHEQTSTILDTIDIHLQEGRNVYVHCWGGVGRTGVIIGCWLARHGLYGKDALVRLRELWKECPKSGWKISPETPQQEHYIINWVAGR